MPRTPVIYGPHPNGDEQKIVAPAKYIGNFHKTLPHNDLGEVAQKVFDEFVDICDRDADDGDFEKVKCGPLTGPNQTAFAKPTPKAATKLNNPQAGRATDSSGPDPLHMEMQPAPGVLSESTAAEMVELYWMALLRDLPFEKWGGDANVKTAIKDLTDAFPRGLGDTSDRGRLQLGTDLRAATNKLDLRLETL